MIKVLIMDKEKANQEFNELKKNKQDILESYEELDKSYSKKVIIDTFFFLLIILILLIFLFT